MKKVLWLGVTPLEKFSDRVSTLLDLLGDFHVDFVNTTSGMETYDSWAKYLDEWNVIATDEEQIHKSWENFLVDNNESKQIVQYKDGKWTVLMPGFSKDYPKER